MESDVIEKRRAMFFFDKRILYIILAVCVVSSLVGYMSDFESLKALIFSVPGVLIAITFHEYAHAFAAYKLGDDTAREQGRLTLNPLKHVDPFGLIMFLFIGIGWGRPVQVDGRNIKRTISYKKAEALVAFAGPLANFITAILFTVIYALLIKFNVFASAGVRGAEIIASILLYTIILNIGFGVFNLIPLPPLDGSKILKAFLPYNANRWFEENEKIFYIIFIVLWITGIAERIVFPIRTALYTGIVELVARIFGI